MQGKFFEELETGDRFTSYRCIMTETDIVNFTCIIGLMNPLFTDEEFAVKRGLEPCGTGLPTMSIAIALTDEICYGTNTAVSDIDNVRLPAAVNPGDSLRAKTSITNKREIKSRSDRGLITLSH